MAEHKSIALVGEAWGEEEERLGEPFVGTSGRILNSMLRQVGIDRRECLVTNVFNIRPRPKNDVINLCGPKTSAIPGRPMLQRGKYVRAEFASELTRLERELTSARPNIIIALGATAAWALLGTQGIARIRGYVAESPFGKVLPTYHPAAVARDWSLRPIVLQDLNKAKTHSDHRAYNRPARRVYIEPSLADLAQFEEEFILPSTEISLDIETSGTLITCVGLAPRPDVALVVPFFDERQPDRNYWRSAEDEVSAWRWVRRMCSLRKRYVGQNFLYDMAFLWRSVGIPFPNATSIEDTMLMQHAQQPELEKGLGFLASIFTDEAAWKFMGRRTMTIKKAE